MRILATCPLGLESILKKEIERIEGKILETNDKSVLFEGDYMTIARANLWSRVGNKIYLELAAGKVESFDDLFDLVSTIDWKSYLERNHTIKVNATTIKSVLTSGPAIQSVAKKAIICKKLWSQTGLLPEDPKEEPLDILIFLRNDECQILLNTSGEPLHKRGYRTETHDAPLKENLAAGLVLLSNWRFKESFYDPFCGSGTIAIEAAMIARNIAPGNLGRKFAISRFPWFPREILSNAKHEASEKVMWDRTYSIIASDIDPLSISMSRLHAEQAGVADTIIFETKPFETLQNRKDLVGALVTNPPYGIRLHPEELDELYKQVALLFRENPYLTGGAITSFEQAGEIFNSRDGWKNRKLYNGWELCYFYSRAK